MAGKIKIEFERCKGCGLCVAVCPKKCIVISKRSNNSGYFPAQTLNLACTGCAACALVCPDLAIEVTRESKILGIDSGQKKTEKTLSKEKL